MNGLVVSIFLVLQICVITGFKQNIISLALSDCFTRENQIELTRTPGVVDISKCVRENIEQLLLGSHVNTISQLKVNPVDLEHMDGYQHLWNRFPSPVFVDRNHEMIKERVKRQASEQLVFDSFEGPKGGRFDILPERKLPYRKAIVDPRTATGGSQQPTFAPMVGPTGGIYDKLPIFRLKFRKGIVDSRTATGIQSKATETKLDKQTANDTDMKPSARQQLFDSKIWRSGNRWFRNKKSGGKQLDKVRSRQKRSTWWGFHPMQGPTGGIYDRLPIITRPFRPGIIDPRTAYGSFLPPVIRLRFRPSIIDPRTRGKRSTALHGRQIDKQRYQQSSQQPILNTVEGATGGQSNTPPDRRYRQRIVDPRTDAAIQFNATATNQRLTDPRTQSATQSNAVVDNQSIVDSRTQSGTPGRRSDNSVYKNKKTAGLKSRIRHKRSTYWRFQPMQGPTGGIYDRYPIIKRRFRASIIDPRTTHNYRLQRYRTPIIINSKRRWKRAVEEPKAAKPTEKAPAQQFSFDSPIGPTGGHFDVLPSRGPTYRPGIIDERTSQGSRSGNRAQSSKTETNPNIIPKTVENVKNVIRNGVQQKLRSSKTSTTTATSDIKKQNGQSSPRQRSNDRLKGPAGSKLFIPQEGRTTFRPSINDPRSPQNEPSKTTGIRTDGPLEKTGLKRSGEPITNQNGQSNKITLAGVQSDAIQDARSNTKRTGNGKTNGQIVKSDKRSGKKRDKRFAIEEFVNRNQYGSVNLPYRVSITDPTTSDHATVTIQGDITPKQPWTDQQQQILDNWNRFRWLDTVNTALSKWRMGPVIQWTKPDTGFDYQVSKDLIDPRTI